MSRYGLMYRVADFLERSISKKGSNGLDLTLKVFRVLKDLDGLQETNEAITLTVWAADGIWISYKGLRVFLLLPRKTGFRVLYSRELNETSSELHKVIDAAAKGNGKIEDVREQDDYHLWSIGGDDIDVVIGFLKGLPKVEYTLPDKRHPRYFSGEVRQLALEMFDRDGRVCPGTKGRPKHKVGTTERVEFDHILPDALGGSTSALNVQVLCDACNRAKRATAL